MKKHTILVVEDEALIAANLVHTLSSLGYDVTEPVATGEDALLLVKTKKPDLVLMDIQLIGEMNGIETAEKIRAIADIPVVYLTAYADDLRLKQAKLTDPYGYLIKPVHSRELHATIQMALYKHGLDRKLKTSEEKYRNLSAMLHLMCDNMPDMIWAKDLEKRYIFANKAICSNLLNAADTDEPIGKQDMFFAERERIRHKDDPEWHTFGEICRDTDQITMDAGTPQQFDEYGNVQGKFLFLDVNKAPFIDSHGKMIGTVGSARDVTVSKQLEEALKESEERHRLTRDAVNDGIWDWDISTGTAFFSPRWYSMLGYAPNEMPGTYATWKALIHPDDIVAAEQTIQDHFIRGEGDYRVEFRMRTKDGGWKWILSRGRVVKRDADCKPVRMLGTHTDITERKKAEENLVATLKRTQDQQAALNTISFSPLLFSGDVHGLSARLTELSSQVFGVERASVWLFNSKGDELRCTDLYEVMYDRHTYDCVLKRSEYVNEFEALSTAKFIDAHDPLTDPRTAGYVKSYLKPNRITSMLDAVIRVSGQNLGVLCFEHVDRSHHWENDEITFACQLADQIAITLLNRDRKRVEEALRESEEKYRTVADFTYDWEYWRTPDGKYVYVSPSCERITGYRSEEFILDPNLLNSIVHSDDRNHFLDHLSHPESEVCDKNPLEFRIISRSGEERWIGNRGQSVYGHDGKYLGRRGSNRDITQRKLAEEALKVSEEKYRNLFMAGADGIVVHDAQGRNIDANAQACEMLGYSHSELLAMRVSDLIPKEDLKQKPPRLTEVMAGQTVCYERKLQRKDGTLLDLEIRASQVAENTVQAFWRDITERKIAEEALYQANKKLNLLTSITRHDINNQLTVLMGYLTILKRKQPDPVLNEYFVKVDTAAQRISSMIQFTKQYESIGVKAPAWQNCRTVADTATKDAQLGKVMIKNDLPTSAEVFADPLVVKVFYNLIDNAVRYGGKITTIRFSVEEAGEEHIIVCEDDGDGVVAEEKEKIFERGFGKNTGLGLALAREILDITGITIKECGEPGTGARFEMAVPKGAWRIGNSDENKK